MGAVLLTGSSGQVGSALLPALQEAGWDVTTFDIADGQDVRDILAVGDAVRGCNAVVHAAAIAHDSSGTPAGIMATNVLGTWHVLMAAEAAGVERVVVFSSAQVFGYAEGENGGEPLYRPVDDQHPRRAARPYGLSKRLLEDMCEAWTQRTGTPTVVLRPVLVLTDETLAHWSEDEAELGAYVHVDDVASAVVCSLRASLDDERHVRLTLCGPGDYDTSAAARAIGWRATRGWPRP